MERGAPMKRHKALTASMIEAAKPKEKPYKIFDLNRLYLLVSTAGTKSWFYAYRLDGKDCTYGIGRYPDVKLAEARERRAAAEKLVASGIHPKAHDEQQIARTKVEQATTFWGVSSEWIEANRARWSPYYLSQIESGTGRYIRDADIGKRPIRSITTADIFNLVRSVATRKSATGNERKATGAPSVAINLKLWCSAIFRFAIASGRCDNNPADGFKPADAIVKPPIKNNRALNDDELRQLIAALNTYTGSPMTVIAIKLLLLTMTRTIELRAAMWAEFDFDQALWSIPAERMKKKAAHVVPLSRQALVLLDQLKPFSAHTDFLFPNRRDPKRCMAATTINRALGNLGFAGRDSIGFTAHGARGTASTYLNENGFDENHVERQLAHVKKNRVAGAYNKAQYLQQRRAMLQEYADYISQLEVETRADAPAKPASKRAFNNRRDAVPRPAEK